jgi:hypothetical protein
MLLALFARSPVANAAMMAASLSFFQIFFFLGLVGLVLGLPGHAQAFPNLRPGLLNAERVTVSPEE